MSTCTDLYPSAPTVDQPCGSDDVELTPAAITNGVGVISVTVWLLWMLATGRLVTRREHENRVGDLKDRITTDAETIESLTGSVQKQTVNGDLTVSLLRSIDRTANEKSGGE